MKNIFYQHTVCELGGVETFLFELAKTCYVNNKDLTIIYKNADKHQLNRLKQYCKVLNFNDVEKPIRCDKAFFNYCTDIIDYVEANEYIQMIHADFKDKSLANYPLITSDKINTYYAVSENSAKSFREITGKDIEVVYNPINIEKEDRVMTLLSAQRLTPEKGGKRLESMIHELDAHNIPYIWHIFSNDKLDVVSDNVIYHKPTLDIRKWVKHVDYMVLLSDTEGFCYGAYESLCLGTPMIITRLPILPELGCDDSNSIILDFDLSNLDVKEIYKKAGKFKFNYNPKYNKWLDIIQGEAEYKPTFVTIEALQNYYDIELCSNVVKGDKYRVLDYRAKEIIDKEFARICEGD